MNIIAVDDEKLSLESILASIKKVEPDALVEGFRKVNDAICYCEANPVDIAFLDIEMGEISGVELAKKLKLINPQINIIFSTGYSEYQAEAFKMHCSGYIMKPITKDKVKEELDNLRFPVNVTPKHRVRFHCFGNFEVYIDEAPAKFKYEKTKELVAYLVEKGGTLCSNGEIMCVLWEDDDHQSYLHNIRSDLKNVFDSAGCPDVIMIQRGKIGINKSEVDCDLYDMQAGIPSAMNLYKGEYMEQYSWGEFSKGLLGDI